MSCVLLTYYVAIVTIFVCFPNQIECCTDITTLIATNTNFQSDPCYIKWKAEQDAKLDELSLRQEELQVRATEYNRNSMEPVALGRANRQKRYSSSYSRRSNLSGGQIIGVFMFFIVLICCCVGCKNMCCSDDNATATQSVYVLQGNQSASTQVQSTSVMFTNAFENRDNTNFSRLLAGLPSHANENNDNQNHFSLLTESPSHANENNDNQNRSSILTESPSRTYVPPMASRQTSLPSYEEAIRTSKASLKE